MKKTFWMVLVLMIGYPLYGAQLDKNTEEDFREQLKQSLCGVEGALDKLKGFVAGFDKSLLRNSIFCDKTYRSKYTVQSLLQFLDPRLFENRNAIAGLLDIPITSHKRNGKKEVERSVADLIELCLSTHYGFSFRLVEHAFKQCPICVDRYLYCSGRAATDCSIGQHFDKNKLGSTYMGEKLWFMNLTDSRRDINAPIEFNKKYFKNLVVASLTALGDAPLKELREFVDAHTQLPDIDELYLDFDADDGYFDHLMKSIDRKLITEDMTLGDLLDKVDPQFYTKRDSILELIASKRRAPQNRGVTVKKEVAQEKVAAIFRSYLAKGSDAPSIEYVNFMSNRFPICIDDYPYDNRRTLGNALDHKSSPYELRPLYITRKSGCPVQQEGALMQLILGCLVIDDESDEMYKDLESISFITDDKEAEKGFRQSYRKYSSGLSCDEYGIKKMAIETFFDSLNPELFPQKQKVQELAFRSTDKNKEPEHTKESDKAFITQLVRAGLDEPKVLPLIKYGLSNYERVYTTKLTIDVNKILYKGGSVGSYLAAHKELPQYASYKTFSSKGFSKKDIRQKKEPQKQKIKTSKKGLEEGTEVHIAGQKVSMTGLIVTGVIGIIGYVWYKQRQKAQQQSSGQMVHSSLRA